MISHKKYTIGVILCIYGVIKIMVGTLDYILSSNQMDKLHDIPLIKNFVTKDHTISGKMIHYVLVVYGFITLTHGLSILFEKINIDFSKMELYLINLFLGVIIFVFYYLILYTNISVKKDMNYISNYVDNLIIGFSFIIFVPCWMIYDYLDDNNFNFAIIGGKMMLLLSSIILFLSYSTYTIIQRVYALDKSI